MQNHYSLLYREEEREMFPTLKVCLLVFPVGGVWLFMVASRCSVSGPSRGRLSDAVFSLVP